MSTTPRRHLLALIGAGVAMPVIPSLGLAQGGDLTATMAGLARDFLAALDPEQRHQTVYSFDSHERVAWEFRPHRRNGLGLAEMSQPQRDAALALMRSGLSEGGYRKVANIMMLGDRVMPAQPFDIARDPVSYWVELFGEPGRFPWGWRVEGHHVSLNVALTEPGMIAVTPTFTGVQPNEVTTKQYRGLVVMDAEKRIGLELMAALGGPDRATATFSRRSIADIVTEPGRANAIPGAAGIPLGAMPGSARQRALDLLDAYVGNMAPPIAAAYWRRISNAGTETIRFGWAGATGAAEPHYYRLRGPGVLVEYANQWDQPDHIHAVWRDPENDFGRLDLARVCPTCSRQQDINA